jgi:acyl-CoA thioester hydrolase
MAEPHRYRLRVHWEDTDAAGIVYYANYLRFIERARSDMAREAGLDQPALLSEAGLIFAVRRCEIDYLAPARLDDMLEVETSVEALGAATADLRQSVRRAGEEVARAAVRLACVSRDGRPRRMPREARAAFERLAGEKREGP